MFWFHRRNSGAHGTENLIQTSALAGVEPRTLASRLPCTPSFSRHLRHAGGYSRTILTPILQGSHNLLLSICLSVCLSVCLSIYLSIYVLSDCLPICLSVYL